MDLLSVWVMDIDMLIQVKEKILEVFCKNVFYFQWLCVEDVDFEWFVFSIQSYIFWDLDDILVVEDGCKKFNMLVYYKIFEGVFLVMSFIDKKDNILG